MADLGNRGAVDALINSILYDLAPNDSIQPSDHNGMLADILDTLANGLYTTLRTNNETGGIDIIITDGDGVQFGSGAFAGRIVPATLTGNNIYTLPDATGTIALTSDIDNIYNTDGTLTANRTVDMNGNELTLDNGVLKLANTGASSLMVFDPNSDVSTLSPGTTITAGQITNRQLGHLVVDIIANDNDDSFAIRSNKNNLGPNPVDTILKIVSTDGYETNFLNTTVIADARLKNNHFSFYNNSGSLGIKYKNNAGTVTPLSIGDNISNADLTWGASTTQDLNGNDLGFTGGNVGVGTATPDASSILDVNSTTQGSRAFPRVTTAQMNAISTPVTNLVVFNTDLNSLMRYNGSAWVSMASGYGLFSVNDSNGEPTFYSDLQTALNACKTGSNTITLHSNVVITSALSILYASGFTFSSLTIDLNGFSITNNEADSSDLFTITLSNNAAVFQRLKIKNGRLIRTSGTGTHYGINNSSGGYANIETPNLIVYCENSYGAYFNLAYGTTTGDSSPINNLGGAIFITNSANNAFNALWIRGNLTYCNFHTIGKSTGATLSVWASCFNFTTENTSTGDGMYVFSSNNPQVSNFVVKSNSGKALRADCGVNSMISNFLAKSVSGIAVNEERGSSRISNFTAVTGNAVCMVVGSYSIITDAKCYNNSSSDTISATNFDSLENVKAYNAGSGYGINAYINQSDKKGLILNCISHSIGGKGGGLFSSGVGRIVKSKQSIFISDLDTSSGHALEVGTGTSGEVWVENCSMQVKNSGANGLYASSAQTIKAINNSIIGATTPINANVTITASTDLGDGNRSY